jgi:RNA polymerase sigma factor (sigma-70 family)
VYLAAAVDHLPPRDRELIELRFGADLTARQIATLLDMTPGSVDVALHRALARLRAILERDEPPPAVPEDAAVAQKPAG